MWSAGILLGVVLLLATGILMLGPVAETDERDHRPKSIGTQPEHPRR
jgi:hypothetical protein